MQVPAFPVENKNSSINTVDFGSILKPDDLGHALTRPGKLHPD
jgi:hypothetical protein